MRCSASRARGGGVAAGHSGSTLAGAAELVGHGHRRMAGLSGALPATYGTFATDAAPGLGEGLYRR